MGQIFETATGSDFALEHPDADARHFVSSQEDLAIALGVSRRTVARMVKLPGAPGKTANGSYPLSEWKRFRREMLFDDDDENEGVGDLPKNIRNALGEKKLEREQLRVERERLYLDRERGKVVPVDEVKQTWSAFYNRIITAFRQEFVLNAATAAENAENERKFNRVIERLHDIESET